MEGLPYKGNDEVRILGELRATEAAPALLQRWNSMSKKRHQIPWLSALDAILTGDQRRDFLLGVLQDTGEHPQVRLEAVITLANSEDSRGIRSLMEIYERDRKRYGSKNMRVPANDPQNPTTVPWDEDADGMWDYMERVLLLDPANRDTDGDGVPDGSDRNPLTAPRGELSENQRIAEYLFYLHATYLMPERGNLGTPPNVCIVSTTNRWWNGSDTPSLLAGIELIGTDNVILALSPEQCRQYDQLHGPNHTPKILITCNSHADLNEKPQMSRVREMLMKDAGVLKGEKLFSLHEGRADGGVHNGQLIGNGRSWLIRVRKINNVWLPVGWRLYITS